MNKIFLILFLFTIITSCKTEDEQKAIKAVQELIQAETAIIGSGIDAGPNKDEVKFKLLTLRLGPVLNDPDFSDETITSLSAITFYQNLSKETLEDKNSIKITVERNINGNSKTIGALFYIDTLDMINQNYKACEDLCGALIKRNYKEVFNQMLPEITKNTSFKDFEKQIIEYEKQAGKVKSYNINGFTMENGERVDGTHSRLVQFYVILERELKTSRLVVNYPLSTNYKGIDKLQFME